jgi:hypothetical protein
VNKEKIKLSGITGTKLNLIKKIHSNLGESFRTCKHSPLGYKRMAAKEEFGSSSTYGYTNGILKE